MPGKGVRVKLLCEDRRTERLLRAVLVNGGFHKREISVEVAPEGTGAADAWVRRRYPTEIGILRSKNYQNLGLLVAVDGDAVGAAGRRRELDQALQSAQVAPRGPTERLALLIPTWSVETWLLALLGERVEEVTSKKLMFEHRYPTEDRQRAAIEAAAAAWSAQTASLGAPPSLAEAPREIRKLDP